MIQKGLVYLFLIIFFNASFMPVYKVVLSKYAVAGIQDLDFEEEKNTESSKKIEEWEKEYIFIDTKLPIHKAIICPQNFYLKEINAVIFHPEKDSPPPKISALLS